MSGRALSHSWPATRPPSWRIRSRTGSPNASRSAVSRLAPDVPVASADSRRSRPAIVAAARAGFQAVPVGPALGVIAPLERGQAADEELPLAQGRAPRQVAEHRHRSGLVPGLEQLERLAHQPGVASQLGRGRAAALRVQHQLVGDGLADLFLQLRRAQPFLQPQRRLLEPQPGEQPDQLLRRIGPGHAEIEQVLRDLDGRRPHPLLQELPRPQEVRALEQPVVLRSRRLLVGQLRLLDGILVPLLGDQALGLRTEGTGATGVRLAGSGFRRL